MHEVPVLIVAQHSVIGALLGSLIELSGHSPVFPEPKESPSAAMARLAPRLALIDADHPLSRDPLLEHQALTSHCAMLMFSSTLNAPDTESVASERHMKSFTLPIKYRTFVDMVERTLQPPSLDLPFETTGEHGAAAPL